MKAEIIAEKARKSISDYCIEECKAYCCRKGYLILSKEEAILIAGEKWDSLVEKKLLSAVEDGKYCLHIGNCNGGCPRLTTDFKCSIHKDKKRPSACKQFPIFLEGKTIRLSSRCPAVREKKLYPYLSALLNMGYKLAKTDNTSDIDRSKLISNQ